MAGWCWSVRQVGARSTAPVPTFMRLPEPTVAAAPAARRRIGTRAVPPALPHSHARAPSAGSAFHRAATARAATAAWDRRHRAPPLSPPPPCPLTVPAGGAGRSQPKRRRTRHPWPLAAARRGGAAAGVRPRRARRDPPRGARGGGPTRTRVGRPPVRGARGLLAAAGARRRSTVPPPATVDRRRAGRRQGDTVPTTPAATPLPVSPAGGDGQLDGGPGQRPLPSHRRYRPPWRPPHGTR